MCESRLVQGVGVTVNSLLCGVSSENPSFGFLGINLWKYSELEKFSYFKNDIICFSVILILCDKFSESKKYYNIFGIR